MAKKPKGKAKKATGMAKKPKGKAKKATGMAKKPSGKVKKPAVRAERPKGKAAQRAGKAKKPAVRAERPAAKAERPKGKAAQRAGKAKKPAVRAERPAAKAERPRSVPKADGMEEVRRWASKWVKDPWYKTVEVCRDAFGAEELSAEERTGLLALTPIQADLKVVYHLLSALSNDIMGRNPNLWTIVTDEHGDEIIFSCLEREKGGAYVEVQPHDVKDPWTADAIRFMKDRDPEGLFDYLSGVGFDKYGIEPGVVKVANIRFFAEFKRIFEEYEERGDLLLYFLRCFEIVKRIFDEEWIFFAPPVPVFDRLRALTTSMVAMDAEAMRELLGLLLPPFSTAVALRSDLWTVVVKVAFRDDRLRIEFLDDDRAEKYGAVDLARLADRIRGDLGTDTAVALNFEELRVILKLLFETPIPYSPEGFYGLWAEMARFLTGIGSHYSVSPLPEIVQEVLSAAVKIVAVPFAIMRFALHWVPIRSRHPGGPDMKWAFYVLRGEEVRSCLTLEAQEGVPVHIRTVGTEAIADLFKEMTPGAALEEARYRLWPEAGRHYHILSVGIQEDYLRDTITSLAEVPSFRRILHNLGRQLLLPLRDDVVLIYNKSPLEVLQDLRIMDLIDLARTSLLKRHS
jgi:hypothetical protein